MATSSPYYNAEAPVVIQGKAVDSNALLSVEGNGEWTRGEKQPGTCQDMFWAILFYAHLGAIGAVTAKYAPLMKEELAEGYADGYQNNGRRLSSISRFLEDNGGENQQEDAELDFGMDAIWFILGISGLFSCLISTVAMMFMMSFAQGLIKMALFFNVLITALLALLALSSGEGSLALMSGFAFLFSLYYAYVVWNRIPFAASNLVTAISAVRANMGLAFFAYSNLIVSFLWSVWWAIAFIGTSYIVGNCNPDGTCEGQLNGWAVFLFLVSYFWTAQVIKNVVHVTVAGTVGTWWFTPIEASGCCSQGVRDSYFRSITTSFGSICFGSLIVAIVSAVKEVLHAMRNQNNSLLLCLAECLLGCIANLVEYFNSWAFVFVGLYGYGFIEAGKNVMTLFKTRGWTAIVADILVDTVLLMVSLAVGILTGAVVALMAGVGNWSQEMLGGAFIAGMLIGFILCSTLFSVISSAVNAVIVCYAEAPAEFQENHPQLSEQMRATWRQAYPNEFQY